VTQYIIYQNEIDSIKESAEKLFNRCYYYDQPCDPRSEFQEIHHTFEDIKLRIVTETKSKPTTHVDMIRSKKKTEEIERQIKKDFPKRRCNE
jgi:hypothetical protein